jgi:hypothetical protein
VSIIAAGTIKDAATLQNAMPNVKNQLELFISSNPIIKPMITGMIRKIRPASAI